jgi:hypothetical protein
MYVCMYRAFSSSSANLTAIDIARLLVHTYNELGKHSHSVGWYQYQNHVQLNTCIHTFFLPALNDWSRFCEGRIKTVFIFNHSLVHTYTCYTYSFTPTCIHMYTKVTFFTKHYIPPCIRTCIESYSHAPDRPLSRTAG